MDFKKLPKQEEVQEFDLGDGMSAALVELTDENRPAMLEFVLSMYLNDECMYCHRKFTAETVKKSVWAYPNQYGRIVHKECWDSNNLKEQTWIKKLWTIFSGCSKKIPTKKSLTHLMGLLLIQLKSLPPCTCDSNERKAGE